MRKIAEKKYSTEYKTKLSGNDYNQDINYQKRLQKN